jgi:hypothetical protein
VPLIPRGLPLQFPTRTCTAIINCGEVEVGNQCTFPPQNFEAALSTQFNSCAASVHLVTTIRQSTYLLNSLSMPNPPSRMTTCTRNATAHPGLVDVDPKQPRGNGKGKKAAAAEKRQEKQDRREAAVHKIASIEQHMAAEDALDITPGPRAADARAPRKRSQATSRRSQKPLPVSDKNVSDSEMDVDKPESVKHKKKGRETHTDVEENTTDHDTPPKKKARQAKPKIRDSIKSYIKSGEGEESSNGLGSAISKRQAASGRGHHEQDKDFSREMDEDELTVSKRENG